ncbi:hypothetical protein [Lacinutrix sp. Hel_I_90]|uniref:hypothetical protein n=1 Tax=Lacinutrix sp. Hel_I_90 TaxID=1249999 RepID=UPI0005C93D93|nr:hypothetical protein [Lacinutrix sp. Hel_I_90]
MKYFLFFIVFSFFTNENECEIDFNSVGINDYDLNISCSDLKNIIPELKKDSNSKLDDDISIYSYIINQKILNINRKVEYYFAFKEDKLQAYVFNVYSGRDIKYYKFFVKKARENNAFISEKGTSFLETKNNCEKFLRIKSNPNQIIIFGGISKIGSYW